MWDKQCHVMVTFNTLNRFGTLFSCSVHPFVFPACINNLASTKLIFIFGRLWRNRQFWWNMLIIKLCFITNMYYVSVNILSFAWIQTICSQTCVTVLICVGTSKRHKKSDEQYCLVQNHAEMFNLINRNRNNRHFKRNLVHTIVFFWLRIIVCNFLNNFFLWSVRIFFF